MTTFWLTFNDPDLPSDKRFLGVAIFDIDESGHQASVIEIVRKAHKLGINPGGEVLVREVESIPDEYKDRLITDDALLLKLGSRGERDKCFGCNCCWSGNAAPMIQDEVWAAIGMDKQALLCEICLRKRLARDLCVADLRKCPFNDKWFISAAFYKTMVSEYDEPNPVVEAAKQVLDPTDVIPCYTVYLLDLDHC